MRFTLYKCKITTKIHVEIIGFTEELKWGVLMCIITVT